MEIGDDDDKKSAARALSQISKVKSSLTKKRKMDLRIFTCLFADITRPIEACRSNERRGSRRRKQHNNKCVTKLSRCDLRVKEKREAKTKVRKLRHRRYSRICWCMGKLTKRTVNGDVHNTMLKSIAILLTSKCHSTLVGHHALPSWWHGVCRALPWRMPSAPIHLKSVVRLSPRWSQLVKSRR